MVFGRLASLCPAGIRWLISTGPTADVPASAWRHADGAPIIAPGRGPVSPLKRALLLFGPDLGWPAARSPLNQKAPRAPGGSDRSQHEPHGSRCPGAGPPGGPVPIRQARPATGSGNGRNSRPAVPFPAGSAVSAGRGLDPSAATSAVPSRNCPAHPRSPAAFRSPADVPEPGSFQRTRPTGANRATMNPPARSLPRTRPRDRPAVRN